MNAIDNYGDFDLPEEKIGIEIIENTVIDTNQPLLNNIKQKMDEKLKAIEILKSLNNSPCDEIIKYIRKINFQKLEKELIKIADEIKEKYESIQTK